MMNFTDPVLCLFTGFAVPLALAGFVADNMRFLAPAERGGRLKWLVGCWAGAVVAGPGLFATRLVEGFWSGREGVAEHLCGWLACAAWAALYGYMVLNAVRLSFNLG